MKTRGVVGQKIVKISHARQPPGPARSGFVYVKELILENGVILRTHGYETDDGSVGDLLIASFSCTKKEVELIRKDKKEDES